MPDDPLTTAMIALGALVVIGVAVLFVRRTRVGQPGIDGGPSRVLDVGWQFYSKPTTLEPPGTIFRIDSKGRRHIVDTLKPRTEVGDEAFGSYREHVDARVGIVARFFGVGPSADVQSRKVQSFEFELRDAAREVVSDRDLDAVLNPWKTDFEYRVDNRYFVIRECRKAGEITYHLKNEQLDDLGGKAALDERVRVEGTLYKSERSGRYVLKQKFKKPMRVMFQPEEILPVSAGLAGEAPELERRPVREPLVWEDV